MINSRTITTFLLLTSLCPQLCCGWSEGGHNVIGFLAFRHLTQEKQHKLVELIRKHPQFSSEFMFPPMTIVNAVETPAWFAGRAASWPDKVQQTRYDRPAWHYQAGPTLIIGDHGAFQKLMSASALRSELPAEASMLSRDLQLSQAIELCQQVLRSNASGRERAIALCWLGNLIADAHQPCNVGSLYSDAFADGDAWAHEIVTTQHQSLHGVWDHLLGDNFEYSNVRRQVIELDSDPTLRRKLVKQKIAPTFVKPEVWIEESRDLAARHVYAPEVLEWINGGRNDSLELSQDYMWQAKQVVRERAYFAAHRLAAIWNDAL